MNIRKEMLIDKQMLGAMAQGMILFFSLAFFVYCMLTQEQNWDMLGYAASALTLTGNDAGYIHGYVYDSLANYVSDEEFYFLTSGNSYREIMFADPEAFMQQVPYYKIRIVYVGLMLMLSKLGLNFFAAGHLISALAASLGFIIFFRAFKDSVNEIFWYLIPFFFILCGVQDVGQVVTADSLAFLWFALIAHAYMHKHWSIFPLLVTSVLIRTDMLVFVAVTVGYFILFRPELRIKSLIAAAAAVVLYLGINRWTGNYGWTTVFYYVFVSDMVAPNPEEFSQLGVTVRQYVGALISNLKNILWEYIFWLFLVNVTVQLILLLSLQKAKDTVTEIFFKIADDPAFSLTIISCGYVFLHYLLFPAIWSRFFVAQYMVANFGVYYMLTKLMLQSRYPDLEAYSETTPDRDTYSDDVIPES